VAEQRLHASQPYWPSYVFRPKRRMCLSVCLSVKERGSSNGTEEEKEAAAAQGRLESGRRSARTGDGRSWRGRRCLRSSSSSASSTCSTPRWSSPKVRFPSEFPHHHACCRSTRLDLRHPARGSLPLFALIWLADRLDREILCCILFCHPHDSMFEQHLIRSICMPISRPGLRICGFHLALSRIYS
jgi:hypothetical protein